MKEFKFDIDYVRQQFPALATTVNGYPAAFLDGPGGTQVPNRVVEKVNNYMYYTNANCDGEFKTSRDSDAAVLNARAVYADFFNCDPEEVAFGENTSTVAFKIALGLARTMEKGDEIIITDIDHEGNRSPWRTLEDFGMVVKSIKVNPETAQLDFEDFKSKLSDKTKVLAINWAANGCGTISDIKKFIDEAHKVGAIACVDAVHYAPHRPIDVKEIGMDVLYCSAYKFCGPHLGIIYMNKDLGEKTRTIRVMADDNLDMPLKLETGTIAKELVCGAAEAVEFIADIGERHMDFFQDEIKHLEGRRKNIVAGMLAIDHYEDGLAKGLRAKLREIEGVKIYGPAEDAERTCTVSFLIEGHNTNDLAKFMGEKGLFVWDGHYYAMELITEVWKLREVGGLLRVGFAPYNMVLEVDRVVEAVKEFIAR